MKANHIFRAAALTLLFITVSVISSYAIEPVKISPVKDVRSVIAANIKFPNATLRKDYQGSVDVLFKIENGKIIVRNASSVNSDLAKYVKDQLSKIYDKTIVSPMNQYYSLRFTFKLI